MKGLFPDFVLGDKSNDATFNDERSRFGLLDIVIKASAHRERSKTTTTWEMVFIL